MTNGISNQKFIPTGLNNMDVAFYYQKSIPTGLTPLGVNFW